MAIKNEIIDELLKDKDPKTIFTSEGLLGELRKALAERVLNAEMDHHLADSTQDEVSDGEKAPVTTKPPGHLSAPQSPSSGVLGDAHVRIRDRQCRAARGTHAKGDNARAQHQ